MKYTLISITAGLLLSAGAASAQTGAPAEGAAPAPAAIQNAPPDKIAPNMKAGQPDAETHKAPATDGQDVRPEPGTSNKPSDLKPSDGDKTRATDKVPNDGTGTGPLK